MKRSLTLVGACAAALTLASIAFAVDPALKKQAKDADSFKRSDAARTLAKDGSPEAAAILAELFEDKNAYVRDAAVESCESITQAASVDVVAKAATSRDELTRRNVAAALGKTKQENALATLGQLARKDASAAVRAEALDALWLFKGSAAALAIAKDAAADTDPFVRAAAVEAAGRIGGEGAAEIVKKALTDAADGVRCVARLEMRFVARDEANTTIGEAAADASWRVRAQAVDDAAWLREAPSMEALVKLVADPVGRVSGAAHRALQQLSTKDFGRDPDLWKSWWEQAKATWKAPHGKLEELAAAGDSGKATVSYHGIEIASDRVAYVIDFSGSMKDPPTKGGPKTRWDIARAELQQAIGAMPDTSKTNVLLFQLETKRCFDKPTALTPRARKDIDSFCKLTPGERGNLLGGVLDAIAEDDVDTIYLLSDGAPSAGDMVDKTRVQAAIRQVNRTRKVAIHTIGFGAQKSTERGFMEGVARDAGGRCVLK
ncbi:MAG: HEAT repeat domain-containing protein [Planctomycetes bacterium]|nr:HEAT repeat domain-containing protein [Planctomycetota bacterium]